MLAATAQAATKPKPTVDKQVLRQAESLVVQAKQAFRDRQFDDAAKLFMQAFRLTHEPAMVFNAARAYEEDLKTGDAAALFRLYGTIADDPDGLEDARLRLLRLEGRSTLEGASPSAGTPRAGSEPTVRGRTVATAPNRTWAWVTSGLSFALLGGGAALMWHGASASQEANDQFLATNGKFSTYDNDFDRAQQAWNVGAGLAAAGIVTAGAAVWLHARTGASMAIGPDGHGGLSVAGRW